MFIILRVLVIAILICGSTPCFSFSLQVQTGFVHLPDSDYHRLGFEMDTTWRLSKSEYFVLVAGGAAPYENLERTQNIYFGSFDYQIEVGTNWLRPVLGCGFGAYSDSISSKVGKNQSGYMPAFKTLIGLAAGNEYIGLTIHGDTYIGIAPSDLATLVVWPMTNIMVGVYAGF